MMNLKVCSLFLAAVMALPLKSALAQHAGMDMSGGMAMPDKVLLLGQLDGQQVVPPSDSKATATGAFQLDPRKRTLDFRLTYQGLEGGPPQQIALYNFGRGNNGKAIAVLCGGTAKPCPQREAGTIAGRLGKREEIVLNNKMIGEILSERVYVEIVSADGSSEIRGQLGANDLQMMFENYVVELAPLGGGSTATGTAVVSKTYLPEGKVSVSYAATVAGLADTPKAVSLARDQYQRGKDVDLLNTKIRKGRAGQNGSSMEGAYEVDEKAPTGAPNLKPSDTTKRPGLVIKTDKSPDGAVYGALIPVE